jgi:CHASE3 domain sensor protein
MPTPYYFYFETDESQNVLRKFQKNLFFLSLLHISNKYENETFIVRGQKSVEINWEKDVQPQNAGILYSIFNFCYGREQAQDKLEIGRNIITIYHNNESLEKLDAQLEKVEKTVKRHFSLYVNDKIKKFFDETKKANDEAHKYAKETRDAADKVVSNINTSIIGLITAVFSGIVIMARGNKWFLIVAFLLHMFYFGLAYCLNRHFAEKKQREILNVYDQSIGYISNVSDEEKKEIKQMYIAPASNSIDENLKIYKRLIYSLMVLMLILSTVVFFFMPEIEKGKNQNEQQNIKQEEIIEDKTTILNGEQEKTNSNRPKSRSKQVDKENSDAAPPNQNKLKNSQEDETQTKEEIDEKSR